MFQLMKQGFATVADLGLLAQQNIIAIKIQSGLLNKSLPAQEACSRFEAEISMQQTRRVDDQPRNAEVPTKGRRGSLFSGAAWSLKTENQAFGFSGRFRPLQESLYKVFHPVFDALGQDEVLPRHGGIRLPDQ